MVRSRSLATWGLIGVGVFAGCRAGYDEIVVRDNAGGEGGSGASGGDGNSSGGTGGTQSSGGEAGAGASGGTSGTSGSAGSESDGGGSMMGGEGGAPASGGSSGAGESAGGSAGSTGGVAGTSAGSTSGGSGGSAEGGASDGGIGGVNDGGIGGVSAGSGTGGGSGTSGGSGTGGFAGVSSLGDCQTDTYGGRDYVFCNVNMAWTLARDRCASVGMFLVRVDDAAESQWVYDNLYDAPPRQGVWIGASDLASEGEWRWTDGTLFWLGDSAGSPQNGLFSAWYASQPSGQEPRDCAALDGNTLGWYDLDCAIPQPYACESP